MTALVTIALLAATLTVIAYPFMGPRSRKPAAKSAAELEMDDLRSRRDALYAAIKELEFDHQSGSLSAQDHEALETSYKRKAIALLKEMDEREKGVQPEEEIERKVRELRRSKALFCPQCGTKGEQDDKFCGQCGARLPARGGTA